MSLTWLISWTLSISDTMQAINGESLWLPQINVDLCNGCGECVEVCPTDVLALVHSLAIVVQPAACDYCTLCESICPVAAIALPYQVVLRQLPNYQEE